MADKSIGFIETFGLAACVAAADAAVKSANVKLLGFEYAKGDGMCTVKVEGNVGACKAAVEAGKKAAEAVQGSLSGTKSVLLKARPAPSMRALLVDNRETVGGEIALAEGYRPVGDSKKPVLVKNWKPKEEPKAETPMEEAPEPPVVEELEDKTSVKRKQIQRKFSRKRIQKLRRQSRRLHRKWKLQQRKLRRQRKSSRKKLQQKQKQNRRKRNRL